MGQLLAGKLIYLTSLGVVQLAVMFTWGWAWFGLELPSHLAGFVLMSVPTAFACSAFGLVLAATARTRKQLVALANLLVLSISALGGSMFPRFLMPESLQKASLVVFNSWALEGFLKVFWREEPLAALWPEILVLALWSGCLFASRAGSPAGGRWSERPARPPQAPSRAWASRRSRRASQLQATSAASAGPAGRSGSKPGSSALQLANGSQSVRASASRSVRRRWRAAEGPRRQDARAAIEAHGDRLAHATETSAAATNPRSGRKPGASAGSEQGSTGHRGAQASACDRPRPRGA
jgi:hypothetical protein